MSIEKLNRGNSPETQPSAPRFEKYPYRGMMMPIDQVIQCELARVYFGLANDISALELDKYVVDWILMDGKSKSARFRELINASPDLLEKYKKDPDATLREISDYVNGDELVSKDERPF